MRAESRAPDSPGRGGEPREPRVRGRDSAIVERFVAAGGVFVAEPESIAERLRAVRALVFDWDGVFTDGRGGGFAEADSMGVNLLRFGLWLRDRRLPVVAIVSGRDNPEAREFARRERLHAVYTGAGDKLLALRHLLAGHGISTGETAAVFDDINDLGVARECGLRFLVDRPGGPMFRARVIAGELADYVTGNPGSGCAVRETAELMLGLMGVFETVIDARAALDPSYRDYLAQRQAGSTALYALEAGRVVARPFDR